MPTCLAIHITVSYHLLFVFDFTLSYAIPEFWLKRDEEGLKKKQICVIKLNSWGLEQYLLTECVLNHWYLSWYLSSFRKTSVFLGQLSAFFLFISIFLSCDAPCAYRQHALLYVTLLFYLYRKYANLLSRFFTRNKNHKNYLATYGTLNLSLLTMVNILFGCKTNRDFFSQSIAIRDKSWPI